MKPKFHFLAIFLVLTLAILACSLSSSDNYASPGTEPPSGKEPPPADILFQDDFSDSSSGWDDYSSEEGSTEYSNGVYRIYVNAASSDYWANPGLSFKDTVTTVDATKVGGPDDNDFGLLCRYQDIDNYYFFIIFNRNSF